MSIGEFTLKYGIGEPLVRPKISWPSIPVGTQEPIPGPPGANDPSSLMGRLRDHLEEVRAAILRIEADQAYLEPLRRAEAALAQALERHEP
jgi:hypothetical protein